MAQPELSETLKTKLLDSNAIPRDVTLGGITYTVDRPVTAGFKGAVWQVKDHFGRPRALKLAIEADYETRSYLQEISYIAKLDAYPQFARFVDAGIVEIEVANDHHRFVGFVEEWIEGYTLECFLDRHPDEITVSFLRAFIGTGCEILQSLGDATLCHDDLHARNVMITPLKGSLEPVYGIKVIDMGSMKPAGTSKKPVDDLRHIVNHLVLICNVI